MKNNSGLPLYKFRDYIEKSISDVILTLPNENMDRSTEAVNISICRMQFLGFEHDLIKLKDQYEANPLVRSSSVSSVNEQTDLLRQINSISNIKESHYIEETTPWDELIPIDEFLSQNTRPIIVDQEEKAQFDVIESAPTATLAIGGPQYTEVVTSIGYYDTNPPANPYKGDRQDRAKLKQRFNSNVDANVYPWYPTQTLARVYPTMVNGATTYNATTAQMTFSWTPTNLSFFRLDSNETFEAEILFYNYGNNATIPGNGTGWMTESPDSWFSDLPGAYLDTRFMDDDGLKSYAVGTRHASSLSANKSYFARFVTNGIRRNTSRLWQVNYQRGYYFDMPAANLWYSLIAGPGDEWRVFNEEYESSIVVKQFHKYNSTYYAPEFPAPNSSITSSMENYFFDSGTVSFSQMFRYKDTYYARETSDILSSVAKNKNTISAGGHYSAWRFRVDHPGIYSVFTSPEGTGYKDTELILYDHNFNLIDSNDDADGTLNSRITRYYDRGDYYVIMRPHSLTTGMVTWINFAPGVTTIP